MRIKRYLLVKSLLKIFTGVKYVKLDDCIDTRVNAKTVVKILIGFIL